MSHSPRWLLVLLILNSLGMLSESHASPLITEFLADNQTGRVDEEGLRGDWIEIYNPDASNANMSGWALTDNAAIPMKWIFPAVSIPPGQFLLVWADGKNRRVVGAPLHTNFSLSASGEYLALVRPDGSVAQDFGTEYPQQDPDRGYGLSFNGTPLVSANAPARVLIPANNTLAATWTALGFDASSWLSGPTGIGFGVLQPGMTVRVVKQNSAYGSLGSVALTDALLALPVGSPQIAQEYTSLLQTLNLLGEYGDGHYGNNTAVTLADPNIYAVRATGFINIKTSAYYSFGLNSDDGGRIKIDGQNVMVDDTNHGPADHIGVAYLSAGLHSFEVIMWEGGGGDEVEFYAAYGNATTWSTSFQLVGNTAVGGLECLTPAEGSGVGGPISTNVETAMRNVNATAYVRVPFTAPDPASFSSLLLNMRYADGFVAYLNGTEVARRNAPTPLNYNSAATATRPVTSVITPETIDVSAFKSLLNIGNNVLAIQAMNNTAADSAFLILPEVSGGGFNLSQHYFFNSPTPLAANPAPSSFGKVADTNFSVKRGIFPNTTTPTVPFPLTITCATPEATIRYTSDGSMPSATNGTIYSGPINITGTTVIRAMASRPNWDSTNVDTQTYLVPNDIITQSANGDPPAGWPASPVNSQVLDYGMDPDIVNHPNPLLGGAPAVRAALQAIPSMCLTMPVSDLMNPATGIYANPGARGYGWEKLASIELLNDPNGGFGSTCGVRIRGGFSRDPSNPKHSFHIFFRSEWGASKLKYPLFGDAGTDEFDAFDIRTAQNYSWSFGADGNTTFLREEFTRATQGAMGQPYSHGFYFHLYLNGQYWGLFNLDERAEAPFAASYLGGDKDNFDVFKSAGSPGGYTTELAQGTTTMWQGLWNQAVAHSTAPVGELQERYFKMQGLAANGSTPLNPLTDPALLDVDNEIDYMLLVFYVGSSDAPLTGGGDAVNNWFTFRDRTTNRGFVHLAHDMEHSMFAGGDRTGPFSNANLTNFSYANPQFIHQHLLNNPEYRSRFADRAQKHCFNQGALTPAASLTRINAMASVVESAIIAESARWGDAKTAVPKTKADWESARNYLTQNFLPNRTTDLINQLKADALYPTTLQGVGFNQFGGYISSASPVTLASNAQIYYTINGADPRLVGGALNSSAVAFQGGTTSTTTLIDWGTTNAGATWKYRDPSIDLGSSAVTVGHPSYNASNWKHPSFIDTGAEWKSGDAELGFADAPRTSINIGASGSRFQLVYFRKKFTATNVAQITSLNLEIKRDDGAIIYLNGREVGRSNMPGGDIGYEYVPSNGVGGTDEETFFPVVDPRLIPSALVEGENTIAVEIHQTNATSSDLTFDLRLQSVKTTFPQPIQLSGPGLATIKARSFDGTNWGALTEPTFLVDTEAPTLSNLVISEIMYHPSDATPAEVALGFGGSNDFEYVELQNIGPRAIDLANVRFVAGLEYDFDNSTLGRLLLPGQRILLVGNTTAFQSRYGTNLPVAGEFTGTLDNAGETLTLLNATNGTLKSFTYGTSGAWPVEADGIGHSLILKLPTTAPDHASAGNWRASATTTGNPGGTDALNFTTWKTSQNVIADTADDDRDGLTNLIEYALGSSPTQPASAATPVAGLLEEGGETYVTLTFTHRIGADDCQCTPQASTELTNWNAAAMTALSKVNTGDGKETIVYRTVAPQAAEQRIFVRLLVTFP